MKLKYCYEGIVAILVLLFQEPILFLVFKRVVAGKI